MKRHHIIGVMLLVIGLFTCGGIYLLQMRAAALERGEDFSAWSPNAATIRKALSVSKSVLAAEPLEEGAHLKFRTMFQARYREHDPPMAIGLHFLRRNTLKLMCPARMEPWFIDRIAVAAWQEASDDFGAPFDVDIYATYIGMAPKKIGQLRPSPTRPHYATITYFPGK